MSDTMIETVEEAVRATRMVQESLEDAEQYRAALALCKATSAFYSTPSEVLVGLLDALDSIMTACPIGQQEVQRIRMLRVDIETLLNLR